MWCCKLKEKIENKRKVRKRKLSLKYDIAKKTKSIKAVMALLRSFFDKFIKKKNPIR